LNLKDIALFTRILLSIFILNSNLGWSQEAILHNWAGISLKNNFSAFDHDEDNNLIIVGNHDNQVDIDFSSNIELSGVNNLPFQSFIAKYNEQGELLWLVDIEPSEISPPMILGNTYIRDINVDSNGDIICVGEFLGKCDFNSGIDTCFLSSEYGSNAFILKLNSAGDFIWAKTFEGKLLSTGNTGSCSSIALSVTSDNFNNIVIGGFFQGNVDFNPGVSENLGEASVNGTWGGFVVKLDQNGNFNWFRLYNSYYQDAIRNVAVNNNNEIYIGGYFYDSLQVTSSFLDTLLNSDLAASYHFLIAKLTPQGQELWVNKMTIASGSMNRIRLDDLGNIFIGGQFNDFLSIKHNGVTSSFNPYSDPSIGQWGGDGFIAKYSSTGNYEWCYTIGTQSVDKVFDFDILYNGEIILGTNIGEGLNQGTAYYGGAALFDIIDPLITTCSGYIKLNANGEVLNYSKLEYEATRLGVLSNSSIFSLGKVFSSAEFPFDFDPDPGADYYLPETSVSRFGFVHRLTVFNTIEYSGNIILGPNPTNSNITVYIKDKPTKIDLQLIGMNGEIILVINDAKSVETIDLNSLRNGMYFVRVVVEDETFSSQKFIKF
jgi:hypothetical protein